ncbi:MULTISPECIES: DUF1073 domain-containing protein [Caballeronia]|uniref:DUF1073 domain-containing protein n=1 Tax=Caballeronia jiangsuensis TaxID=1458357 RepID=A0ABW9CMX9_9BURK|nr:DUF1073 domain-containing protein [Caballeronia sp. GaOx3]
MTRTSRSRRSGRAAHRRIEAHQEALFTAPLSRLSNVIQVSLIGAIDPDIGFSYVPVAF